MLLSHFLEYSAEKFPHKEAVWFQNNWITYQQIEMSANRVANFLLAEGITRGDRVAILLENSINYIICYFGIMKTGAVAVALNNEITPSNLQFFLNNSESSALITNNRFSSILTALENIQSLKFILAEDKLTPSPKMTTYYLSDILKTGNSNRPKINTISIDLAAIVYTSGSTGEPKGVMLSHQNLTENTISISQYLQLSSNDRIMVVLPFYYIYGSSLLTTHFHCGGSVVIDNRFVFPNVIISTMEKTQVTGFAGVPSTFNILLNKSIIKDKKIASLRYVTQAGGAMAPSMQLQVAELFSPAKLFVMYGTTEAAPRLTYLHPDMLFQKLGSIGKAIPNVEVLVVNNEGKPVAPGQTGEIAARGSNIMMGYWKDTKSTNAVIRDGLYYTGDLGKTDSEGYIYVVGRTKDMIKVGGNRVSAKEIEEALISLPEVSEAAVIGVPDTILGEAIKAFIVFKTNFNPDIFDIRKRLASLLGQYKIPKQFVIRNELPKNESGKIMKEILKSEIS